MTTKKDKLQDIPVVDAMFNDIPLEAPETSNTEVSETEQPQQTDIDPEPIVDIPENLDGTQIPDISAEDFDTADVTGLDVLIEEIESEENVLKTSDEGLKGTTETKIEELQEVKQKEPIEYIQKEDESLKTSDDADKYEEKSPENPNALPILGKENLEVEDKEHVTDVLEKDNDFFKEQYVIMKRERDQAVRKLQEFEAKQEKVNVDYALIEELKKTVKNLRDQISDLKKVP